MAVQPCVMAWAYFPKGSQNSKAHTIYLTTLPPVSQFARIARISARTMNMIIIFTGDFITSSATIKPLYRKTGTYPLER